MDVSHSSHLLQLRHALLHSQVSSSVDTLLRQAIVNYVATLWCASPTLSPSLPTIPANLIPYIDKVARHAYRVTDEDVEALRQAGYSDDAVLEITLCVALGAASFRYQQGISAVQAAQQSKP